MILNEFDYPNAIQIFIQFQMENSKTLASNELFTTYVAKLEKIRAKVSAAEDYLSLEKCISKIEKLKIKVNESDDRKLKKELSVMFSVIESIIKEKTKYFKKKMINKDDEVEEKDAQIVKTLIHSKSAQNFKSEKPKLRKSQLASEAPQIDELNLSNDANKTRIHKNRDRESKKEFENLQSELSYYKNKANDLQATTNITICRNEMTKFDSSANMMEQYNIKIREKGLQIQQIKGKLKYYEQKNQQLKNKVLNSEKRSEDYINQLKKHIQKLNDENLKLKKDNSDIYAQLQQTEKITEIYKSDNKKLTQKVETLTKQKQQLEKIINQRKKDQQIKNDLQNMALQQKYISDCEALLQKETQQKEFLNQKVKLLLKQNQMLHEQKKLFQIQKQKSEGQVNLKFSQYQKLQIETRKSSSMLKRLEEQLFEAKKIIMEMERQRQNEEYKKQLNLQYKMTKLKQVRSLLQEIN